MLLDTADPAVFRAHVRGWLDRNAPAKGSPGDFSSIHLVSATSMEEYTAREHTALAVSREWQRALHGAGLVRRSWPQEYGGHGAPAWQDAVVAEELPRYGVSTKILSIGLEMMPPLLLQFGTEAQRLRWLPPVVRAEHVWCQLLSEPDAGSDLASVTTRATKVDGGWSVSGQKVWNSNAGIADFALLIARTGGPGRSGLSCFALEMRQTGVEVRPLRQMNGAYHFNECFLDDAFVPDDAIIGEPGGGWPVLLTMLSSERSAIGGGTSARSSQQLVELARAMGCTTEPAVRDLLVRALARERVLDLLKARLGAGVEVPAGGPVVKLLYSDHARFTADAAMTVLGAAAMDGADEAAAPWVERLLFAPGLRLGGGTDEIMRNTIAEKGLGLPREPAR